MKRSTATGKHTATFKVKKIKKKNSTTPAKKRAPTKGKSAVAPKKTIALKSRLTKQIETEVLKAYYTLWNASLSANMKTFSFYLADDFSIFGSANGEVFYSKQDAVKFYTATADETRGKAELRNRNISVQPLDTNSVIVREESDLYVLLGKEWRFYGHARISCVVKHIAGGWKAVHQHASFPDHRTEEGHQLAAEKIEKENLELREAVKRRTVELESKNRELEIEASLEKVRAQALGMHKSEDLLAICRTLYKELAALGFDTLRNAVIHVFHDERACLTDHEYSDSTGGNITTVPFKGDVTIEKFIKRIRKSENAFVELKVEGKELSNWKSFRKKTGQIKDNRLNQIKAIHYYIYSVGHASIGISSFNAIEKDKKELLKRFRNVFDFAYRRYTDIAQAQAQAREAQIEAALERVRAKTMAMQKSDELPQVANLLFQQVQSLGMPAWSAGYCIWDEDKRGITLWMSSEGVMQRAFHAPLTEDPSFIHMREAYERNEAFHVEEVGGEALVAHYKYMRTLPVVGEILDSIIAAGHPLPTYQIFHCVYFSQGFLLFITYEPVPQAHDVFKRFGKVFDQTYTRFLDLQKAEAQAREAHIEAALERVRSRSMAMHKSEELPVVIQLVFEQLRQLNFNIDSAQFDLNFRESDDINLWTAVPGQPYPTQQHIPYFNNAVFNSVKHAKEAGLSLSVHNFTFEEKNEFFNYFFKHTSIPEERRKFILSLPGWARSVVYLDRIYLGIQNYSGIPYSDAEHVILVRFAKVFEQAYTRFLDLQKAEAQAREAQIETALEKVRSRSLAMHTSSELNEVVKVLFEKLTELQVPSTAVGIQTFIEGSNDMQAFVCGDVGTGIVINQYRLPYFDHPIVHDYLNAHKNKLEVFVGNYSKNEKDSFYDVIIKLPELKDLAAEVKTMIYNSDFYEVTIVPAEKSLIVVNDFQGNPLAESQVNILKRFAKVFDQTYTRFLDLQKAEAQARESQIQLALERVRAKTMAMQHSGELREIAAAVHDQLLGLGFTSGFCSIVIMDRITGDMTWWMFFPGKEYPESYHMPFCEHPFYLAQLNRWKQGEKYSVIEVSGEEKKSYDKYTFGQTEFKNIPIESQQFMMSFEKIIFSNAYMKHGAFSWGVEPIDDAHAEVLQRFAKVFDQSYTRFLDLQRAEAQAQEAQIEAALERVRSQSMAMHMSEELTVVASVLFQQLQGLGINSLRRSSIIIMNENVAVWECWYTSLQGDVFTHHLKMPIHGQAEIVALTTAWQRKEIFQVSLTGVNLTGFMEFLLRNGWKYAPGDTPPKKFVISAVPFSQGAILSFTSDYPSPPELEILGRFAKVFQQTYTRFLDIQKAEAQAREAQVETSLERVRSKTMAMHNSQEVGESVATLFDELLALGVLSVNERCGIGIMQPDEKMEAWTAAKTADGKAELTIGYLNMTAHPLMEAAYHGWAEKLEKHQYILEGEDILRYYDAIRNQANYKIKRDYFSEHPKIVHTDFYFNEGCLYVFSLNEFSSDSAKIFLRFAAVFGQTYRRYLDLQKAEAQAREAQIEAAMEKVRSRAMAMQKPNELVEVAKLLRKEMGMLGVEELETSSIYIHNHESGMTECWYAIKDEKNPENNLVSDHMLLDLNDTWVGKQMADFYHSNNKQTSIVMTGENRLQWINYCASHSKVLVGYYGDNIPDRTYHLYKFPGGYMGAASTGSISNESWDLLQRACSVFSLAYTRFKDLQQAEARAREAVKQAALDRVRADIASMRNTSDLDRIIPLIWKELTTLGIPFIRCGVFIMDELLQQIHTFLSTPDGKAIAAFHLPYDSQGRTREILTSWMSKQVYIEHWDETAFSELGDLLVQQGAMPSKDVYMKTIPAGGLYLHCLPFMQGMLYVGNTIKLNEEEIQLIQSVAEAFATAYARYEDFNKLEAAKQQVDKALVELKQTQQQLVQSEKMASLGELTAGIAHEIQNPLNFVNNFSEVSNELIKEIQDIRHKTQDQGNKTEEDEILNDIASNLQKINHHGKRAADIVKGMLQHSRTSSGQKELTDINALADEYLRLAYHGLRAKDKSFNAKFETHLDPTLPKLNVIPQDIGRVLLNLINNAFYAVSEKSSYAKASEDKYEPTVIVSTKNLGNKIEISVKDNGNGIPESIKEKIFQPFFTTKPTGQGTGLGLSLSYDIVKAHGGELKLATKQGEGSTFTIYL